MVYNSFPPSSHHTSYWQSAHLFSRMQLRARQRQKRPVINLRKKPAHISLVVPVNTDMMIICGNLLQKMMIIHGVIHHNIIAWNPQRLPHHRIILIKKILFPAHPVKIKINERRIPLFEEPKKLFRALPWSAQIVNKSLVPKRTHGFRNL